MNILKSAAIVVASTLISFSAQAGESYNMTSEFSILNGNPNGVWTYGHYTSGLNKGSFSAFNAFETGVLGSLNVWRDSGTDDSNVVKNVGVTGDLCCGITFHGGAVTFGPFLGPAVVRFTVPGAGDWQVDATFAGVQAGNAPATAWIHNGTDNDTTFDLVDAPVADFPVTSGYSQLLTGLPAGATIDIVVGNGSRTTEVSAIITKMSLNVGVDIKPGSDPNSINLCSNGAVPVAILGTDTFDVYDIDTDTLKFADAAVKVVGKKDPHSLCSYEDVNDDGNDDLVCHFVTMDIDGIDGTSVSAAVSGKLLDAIPFEGMDTVNIVKDTCN